MSFDSEVRQIVFTDPADPAAPNHATLILQLIRDTPNDGVIHGCINNFSDTDLADAMITAAQRGVTVRLILGSGSVDIARYFSNQASNGDVEVTSGIGCFGNSIHTKLFLFSQTKVEAKTMGSLVLLGSFTLTAGGLQKQQNTVVIADSQLYDALVLHWENMRVRTHNDPNRTPVDVDLDFFSASGRVKAYLFPRSSDLIPSILGNVKSDRHQRTNERPTIRLAMARWTASRRGMAILGAVLAAGIRGCRIELVLRRDTTPITEEEPDDGVSPAIIFVLKFFRYIILGSRMTVHVGRTGDPRSDVHSKYFTVSGVYASGSAWEEIVWTGSPNFTRAALRSNDEIMVKIGDAEAHRQYRENFERLKGYCTGS